MSPTTPLPLLLLLLIHIFLFFFLFLKENLSPLYWHSLYSNILLFPLLLSYFFIPSCYFFPSLFCFSPPPFCSFYYYSSTPSSYSSSSYYFSSSNSFFLFRTKVAHVPGVNLVKTSRDKRPSQANTRLLALRFSLLPLVNLSFVFLFLSLSFFSLFFSFHVTFQSLQGRTH